MEDRHTFSEPRLSSSSSKLEWEVDIYRKGVADPIETLTLSDETLPPRVNKRGKVVWRLPTEPGRLPSFGTDERRRIMDLFKERKKNRRKRGSIIKNGPEELPDSPKCLNTNTETNSGKDSGIKVDSGNQQQGDGSGAAYEKVDNDEDINNRYGDPGVGLTPSTFSVTDNALADYDLSKCSNDANLDKAKENNSGTEVDEGKGSEDISVSNPTCLSTSSKKKKKKKLKRQASSEASSLCSSGGEDMDSSGSVVDDCRKDTKKMHQIQQHSKALPPGLGLDQSPIAPPGFKASPLSSSLPPTSDNQVPDLESSVSSLALDGTCGTTEGCCPEKSCNNASNHSPSSETIKSENITHESIPISNKPLVPPPTSRYIIIPERDRPKQYNIPSSLSTSSPRQESNTSLAVAAAKAFVDLYYPHLTHGLSADLAMHYTPHAQKSVSIGGAHSVVTGRADITVQIASLAGTVFVVRGVVAQDTYDSKGAHVLVTGVVQTNALGGNGAMTPFAHSISLAPAISQDGIRTDGDEIPFAFQIHNDALSLMTVGDSGLNDPYQGQQQQQPHGFSAAQNVRQPPPGLFG